MEEERSLIGFAIKWPAAIKNVTDIAESSVKDGLHAFSTRDSPEITILQAFFTTRQARSSYPR